MAHESHIKESGIYDGEVIDFTAKINELTPCIINFNKDVLTKQINEPVRDIQCLKVKEIIITPKGDKIYDFGQNFAGVVKIKTPKSFKGTITLNFAEVLINGEFYTKNLRRAKVTDKFTGDGETVFCP